MTQGTNRREFMRVSTMAGVAAALSVRSPARGQGQGENYRRLLVPGFSAPPLDTVRMAFVGVGLQGGWHVRNCLKIEAVEVKALCDIDESRALEVRNGSLKVASPHPTSTPEVRPTTSDSAIGTISISSSARLLGSGTFRSASQP